MTDGAAADGEDRGRRMPEPVAPTRGPGWDLRASDAERAEVLDLLRGQVGEGRIDLSEFEERVATVSAARSRSQMVAPLADLPVHWVPPDLVAPSRRVRRGLISPGQRAYVSTWLALSVLWWGIWAAVSIGTGEPNFPWPIFPMLGMGIPVLIGIFSRLLGGGDDESRDER